MEKDGTFREILVITKDEEIDLPPCYTDRTVTVTNGEGHGSQTYSAECFKEGSGTYSSDVTWTKPPAYMKPGSSISFSMKFTSPDGKPTGGAIKANGGTIVEGDSRNPQGNSTATYTVPNGSPGNELEIYTSFIMVSGLHGYVTYKYNYQGAGAEEAQADAGESGQIDTEETDTDQRSSKTFDPKSLKPRTGLYLSDYDGNVLVVRNGEKIPAKRGFQIRVGDLIETSDGFAWIKRDENGFKGLLRPNSKLNIDEADLNLLEEFGAMYIGFHQEMFIQFTPIRPEVLDD